MSPAKRKSSRKSPRKIARKSSRSVSKSQGKGPTRAEDIFNFKLVTGAAMSRDEARIAYTVEIVSDDHRKYFNNIHVYDRQSETSRQFTFGDFSDSGMSWSPDGSTLAFISTRNKKTGIYLISTEGGAERKLVELDGSFSDLQWYPDGSKILFSFRKNDSFEIEDEKKKKEEPLYRHVTRFYFRLDGTGFLPQDPTHVWNVNVETGKTRQLTRGKLEHTSAILSPDGKKVYFISCEQKDPDRYADYNDIYVFPSTGGKVRKLKSPIGPKYTLAVSPDGKNLAWLGHDDVDDAWGVRNTHIWVMPARGGQAKDIIAKFDRHAIDQTIGDTGEAEFCGALQFSADGKRIYFISSDTGNTHLFYAPTRGGAPTRITKRPMHIKGFSLGEKTSVAALVMTNLKRTPELYTVPTVYHGDKQIKQLTKVNRQILNKIDFGKTSEVWFKSFDGTEIQGWLTLPPKFSPRKKYPAILNVHGGPRAQYGASFFHEMNYLSAQGYVVLYTNPRGGNGRGETFAAAIAGGWGDLDYKDVLAAADYLEAQKFVNKKRMGITGGSYGGYMTNWVIGHTNRFKAAVTQRCVADLFSFVGSSDIGFELYREFGGQPWENADNYKECSPLTHIGPHVRTPLLILHSEQDLRCNIEQSEQMFVKMKWLGKTVEMIRFPEESHGLSRHGRPDRRVARLEWLKKWFDKYLK